MEMNVQTETLPVPLCVDLSPLTSVSALVSNYKPYYDQFAYSEKLIPYSAINPTS